MYSPVRPWAYEPGKLLLLRLDLVAGCSDRRRSGSNTLSFVDFLPRLLMFLFLPHPSVPKNEYRPDITVAHAHPYRLVPVGKESVCRTTNSDARAGGTGGAVAIPLDTINTRST